MIKATRSANYYEKICDTEKKFTTYLQEKGLVDKPISEIRVRDIQLFLNSFNIYHHNGALMRIKKDLPKSAVSLFESSEIRRAP